MPKAKAKPTAQYTIAAIEKLVRILATTVPAFFLREKPISSSAKPDCMKITRRAASTTQSVLMGTETGTLAFATASCRSAFAATGKARLTSAAPSSARPSRRVVIAPPRSGSSRQSMLRGRAGVIVRVDNIWADGFSRPVKGDISHLCVGATFACVQTTSVSAEQITGELTRFIRLAMRAQHGDAFGVAAATELSFSQLRALCLLEAADHELAMTELAPLLGLSPAATGRALDVLAAQGYVDRRPDADDRRVKRLALTATGRDDRAERHLREARRDAPLRRVALRWRARRPRARAGADPGPLRGDVVSESTAPRPGVAGLDAGVLAIAGVVVLGAVMSILDTTIVNVAIDALSREFHTPLSTIQWVSTGYMLALATVIPLTGWAADRFGTKRLYMVSIVLFLAGSALCGHGLVGELADRLPRAAGARRRHDHARGHDDHDPRRRADSASAA